jgi:hypothetical protein
MVKIRWLDMPKLLIAQAALCVCCLVLLPQVVWAQPGRHKEELSWDRKVGGLFQRYCYSCHGREEPSGGINLAQDENPKLILDHPRTWSIAVEALKSQQMPPEDERQPDEHERQLMIAFLEETLSAVDCEQNQDPGKPTLRRLNRTEYDNAVLDVTGLDLKLAVDFPPDSVGYGFDNIGDALTLTPTQIELFHDAARKIVAAMLDSKEKQAAVYQAFFEPAVEKLQLFAEQHVAPANLNASQVLDRVRAGAVLTNFAERAFRGPVEAYYLNRLLRIYDRAIAESESSDAAIGHCLTAILISPRFLYRLEHDQPELQRPYLVSHYELASRMSFFLWSRPPDEQLLDLARAGRLHDPQVLREQTLRMLKDRRSRALVDNFFAQWLDLRRLETHEPDPDVFPEFDLSLRRAMRDEVNLLLLEIIVEDLPVTQLLDSDHIFANARLAEHYGLPPIASQQPVRIDLPDRRRGGLIATAGWLMLQSDPGRSNIPRRGNFIAGQLFGDPPPPPPPGVPPLDASQDGTHRSLRETFELHRRSPECRTCHAKIDPMGFSLENFDAIGRWRETDAGLPIDSSAEMSNGARFVGIVGLKDHLLAHQSAIIRELSNRLLIYALGRGLTASDQCVVDRMLQAAQRKENRFSALVLEVVTSIPFTHRQNPEY